MTAQEIRKAYLDFFVERGHKAIPRALLVPYNDPTTLFTGSGMQPLIPYLLGEPHPEGKRLVNSQTCLRAQDIEEVGDNRHTTFFEMLGNWSLGDYFKQEQINWFWEFLTDKIGLDPNRIYVTCFRGDETAGIPRDIDSANVWREIFKKTGIEAKEVEIGTEEKGYEVGEQGGRIFFTERKTGGAAQVKLRTCRPVNRAVPTQRCFIYILRSNIMKKYGKYCHVNCDCGRYIELGNSVFMEYIKTETGFDKLPKKNVDYGGGLERIAAAAIDSPDVFEISLIKPIITKLEDISGKNYESHTESMRVIADHLRAATFLAVDVIVPSNKEQGYVMRRQLRRAIRFAFELGIEQNFLEHIVPVITDIYGDDFPEVAKNRGKVIEILMKEEKIFRQTLRKGLNEFNKLVDKELSGEVIFKLYDTYGFPVELSKEEAFKKEISPAKDADNEFDRLMQEQRQRSQTASKGVFKGGLGGQTLQHKKYHTATHLMYQALRDVLGDHVIQRGSNITEERLRFDFSHPEKMKPEQIKQVESIVNEQIAKDLKVSFEEYPAKVAIEEKGALGQFGDRYGDTVKVYKMIADDTDKPFSFEICGGPHVDHTQQLVEDGKKFKIIKEESSSAGIRRIKAVLQ